MPSNDTEDQGRRLETKFAGLVEPVLGSNRCAELISRIRVFESLPDVRGLMALTAR